jgi:NTF2 fold immunity protein
MRVWTISAALWLLAFLLSLCQAQSPQTLGKPMDEWKALEISLKGAHSIHPIKGFAPDESTAVKIGEAAAVAQYGEKRISDERPFRARLYGDTWIVKGTLHPQGALGGTAVVKAGKADGRILFMTHQE